MRINNVNINENKVSIKDVAKYAKVSTMTVSHVINNHSCVKEERYKRVLDAIRELGYIPNKPAQMLRRKTSNIETKNQMYPSSIGIILMGHYSKYNHPYHSEILEAVEEIGNKKNINISFVFTSKELENPILYNESLSSLSNLSNSGIIIIGDIPHELYLRIKQKIKNIVSLNYFLDEDSSCVNVDYFEIGCKTTKYLIELGHKKIGFVGGLLEQGVINDSRFDGYKKTLQDNNIGVNHKIVEAGGNNIAEAYGIDAGFESMNRLLDRDSSMTAVFAVSDLSAIGAMKSINKKGLKVPDDISLISCDDLEIVSHLTPSLTTTRIDRKRMAELGIELLMERIKNPEQKGIKIVMPSELIIRESCRNFNHGIEK